jgi:hypothetical protein
VRPIGAALSSSSPLWVIPQPLHPRSLFWRSLWTKGIGGSDIVQVLTMLGYNFVGGEWRAPAGTAASLLPEADAMLALPIGRADALAGCTEGSSEEKELESIVNAIEAYQVRRWPEGKIPGGEC